MFDNQKLGAYIQFLRKTKGLTQGKLAECLGISHQAVSNWERGESMPDISMLAAAARALGTSVDRMLSAAENYDAETYAFTELIEESADEAMPKDISAPKAVDTSAPEQNCEQKTQEDPTASSTDTIFEMPQIEFPDVSGIMSGVKVTIKSVLGGLKGIKGLEGVFESLEVEINSAFDDADCEIQETLEEIEEERREAEEDLREAEEERREAEEALRAVHVNRGRFMNSNGSSDNGDNWNKIISLAPYASTETLDALVDELDFKASVHKVASIAPFLSRKSLEKLIERFMEDSTDAGWNLIVVLAPYLNSEVLERLVTSENSNITIDKVRRIAPFLCRETVDKLIKSSMKN